MSTSEPRPTAPVTAAEPTTAYHDAPPPPPPPPSQAASTSQHPIPAAAAVAAAARRPPIAAHPLVSSWIPLEPDVYASLRVTLHGQMSKQIQFAHSQLLTNKPLVLHAMPPHPPTPPTTTTTNSPLITSNNATAVLPRLISTCEILKRTFTDRLLELKYASDEIKTQLGLKGWIRNCKGLHQYTLLTTMQKAALVGTTTPIDQTDGQGGREEDDLVREWLLGSGKKNSRPKTNQHASPLLIIVLSPYPIEALANDRAFTYQGPEKLPRLKRSKPMPEKPIHQDPPVQTTPLEEVEMEEGEIPPDAPRPLSIVNDTSTTTKKVKVRPNRKKKRLLQEAAEALSKAKELRMTLQGKATKLGQGQSQGKKKTEGGEQGEQGKKQEKQVKTRKTRRSKGKSLGDGAAKTDDGAKADRAVKQ
ncbi:BZ3500_MvSof-1268-A1-R1_Chr3-2g06359 [Microbotryum saponariae]|uniref:BZ3500_MvSof-1268-A1-R1_Chr3-2g06359 protein n=1 Tax=Microbotryum saponariae TaxID=289078 RepID=A0A2X0LGR9_9BASI|nr:BZ3500_MvSof-1268-A1-R1_Chr3-2g06359 [Microbotryum saponariae]SDA04330.1 BZ3501_MvSof-1269-A2-R1_Chr3-2g06050 [Microbotryum saponariae]